MNAQEVYFIKYNNNIDKEGIEQKIIKNNLSPKTILKSNTPELSIERIANNVGIDDEDISRIVKVTAKGEINLENYLEGLKNSDPTIQYVQKASIYELDIVPDDSLVAEQWALKNIKAFEAWDISSGTKPVLLCIIDTGIDYLHPDLKNKIYVNNEEIGIDGLGNDKRTNGIDDDQNGFIDDWQGWDFTDRIGFPFDSTGGDYLTWDNNPMDENGHGTIVAGVAGAVANNSTGIAGIAGFANNISLLNLRAFDPLGFGEEDDVAAAILYAVEMGAKVINMSFGDKVFSYVLRDVIKYAYSQGVVLIGSSGNSNSAEPHYPSGYSEVISVGSSTKEDRVSQFSNFGSTLDMIAPGSEIRTTAMGNSYTVQSGTSLSCPYVSSSAALILSEQNFTNEEIKQILKSTSDDVDKFGWDEKSGAGRLNLYKALSILAPANIKINKPLQDFATNQDSLKINVTVLSPYFVSYNLFVGSGLNPKSWDPISSSSNNQVLNENILTLNINNLSEGSYTLRLAVTLNTGVLTEERINFHIIRTTPKLEIVGEGPVYYGEKSTILVEAYSSQRSIVRMYYREKGLSEFDFITLDGFATNNQFVKQLHYGFIPKQIVKANTVYEVYFEAENMAGLKAAIDNGNNYFEYKTESGFKLTNYNKLLFKLPRGNLFAEPVNFLSSNYSELLFNEFYPTPDTIYYSLYHFENEMLNKIDSIAARFPRSIGDFNGNGKIDLLGGWYLDAYIDEQFSTNSFKFQNKQLFENRNSPTLIAKDINNDGNTEILWKEDDTSIGISRIANNFSSTPIAKLENFSFVDSLDISYEFVNHINSNLVFADANNDGIEEIWFYDKDGDLLSYKILSNGRFEKGDSLITRLYGLNGNVFDEGDFNGDGEDEIAVVLETKNIANNYILLVFNFRNNNLNILLQKTFLDQSMEFGGFNFSKVYQSLRFVDLDNDNNDEIVLNLFPYLYVFKNSLSGGDVIFYKEGVNNQSIFSGDINQNGLKEIVLQHPEGNLFYEFGGQITASQPNSLTGYSIDSAQIFLFWESSAERHYIYKGTSINNIFLYDSVFTNHYTDSSGINKNKNYYYKIKSYDTKFQIPISNFTSVLEIYSHEPAKIISASNNTRNSVLVSFSERINNTIENLKSFEIVNLGSPRSVAPSSQYSYLITFDSDIPLGNNKLVVRKLNDFFGSPIHDDTLSFNVDEVTESSQFFISSHEIINPYLIKIVFNYEVDENTISNKSNYTFQPANNIKAIKVENRDKRIIYIELEKNKPVGSIGRQYTLKIENLHSSQSTGYIEINSGAGGTIVLTDFAEDLSKVYVYPNPAKIGSGVENITFANLPQRAKISIWNLNGEHINDLEETDGDGGAAFNLRDKNNLILSSGIYIYRITRNNDSDEEIEEMVGKFAVIR